MRRSSGLATVAVILVVAVQAHAQSFTFDFETGTDQGFGTGFGNDASKTFPIVTIGGSKRMEVLDTSAFQQAGRETSNPADPQYVTMLAASADESRATLSYDWYVNTALAPGMYGTELRLGTYINSGSGYYAQNYPATGKEVELNAAQLASGSVFSGTVSFTLASKGYNIPAGETFFRFGLIVDGNGTQAKVYYDNIRLAISASRPGDFDADGDVDGRDFLVWQRGGSPSPMSSGDLAAWRTNFGTSGAAHAANAVPEPAAAAICLAGLVAAAVRQPPRTFLRRPSSSGNACSQWLLTFINSNEGVARSEVRRRAWLPASSSITPFEDSGRATRFDWQSDCQ